MAELPNPDENSTDEQVLKCINIDNMIPFKKYHGNKQGTLSFTIVSPDHIEDERTLTAVKIGRLIQHKRKVEQTKVDIEKKAKRDAFYAEHFLKLTVSTREMHARNAYTLSQITHVP